MLRSLVRPDTFRKVGEVNVLFFSHDVDLSETLDGKPYDRLLDSITEICTIRGMNNAHVAHPYSVITGMSSWAGHYQMNRASIIAAVFRKGKLSRLADSYSQSIYRKILLLAQPKIVFTIGLPAALCRAARSLGIEIVEVLHGKGYPTVPWGWEKRLDSELPSTVLALDAVSFHTFSSLNTRGVRVIFVEDFWLKRFASGQDSMLPTEWQFPEALPLDQKHVVLVSLQWGSNKDYEAGSEFDNILENGFLPPAIMDAIVGSHQDVLWLLRLHPVQLRSDRRKNVQEFMRELELANPNVEWQISTERPLPSILSRVTRHATMNSATAVEAAEMGVPTALLCPTLAEGQINGELFSDLRTSGFAKHFELKDAETLLQWIREPLPLPPNSAPKGCISIDTAIDLLLAGNIDER